MAPMKWIAMVSTLLLLAGCSIAPEPREAESVPLPQSFSNATQAGGEVVSDGWWKSWGDPVLDSLVEKAVEGNISLKIAATRIGEAATVLAKSRGGRMPSLDFDASAGRARTNSSLTGKSITNSYSTGLTLSYVADIWGAKSEQQRSSQADMEAYGEDQLRAYQVVVGAVVATYVDRRAMAEQARLSVSTADTDRERLSIVEERYASGLVPSLDVYLARQAVAEAESRVHLYGLQADAALHALNVLAGQYPTTPLPKADEVSTVIPVPGEVPAGLPSTLVARRPDIRASLKRLKAAYSMVVIAETDLLPQLRLTSSVGFSSSELNELLDMDQLFWNMLAGLTAPIFDGGRLDAAALAAHIKEDRAVLNYGNTVLTALKEVEDALMAERYQRRRLEVLELSAELAQASVNASEERYRQGLDNLLPTLSARLSRYQAQSALIATRQELLKSRTSLHLALGGDWGHENQLMEMAMPENEK